MAGTTRNRRYYREAQRLSRWRRRTGRTLKVYCASAKCRGHWLSAADCERERAAGRPYYLQPML